MAQLFKFPTSFEKKKKVFYEELEELICKMPKMILLAGLEGDIDSMGTPPNETPQEF